MRAVRKLLRIASDRRMTLTDLHRALAKEMPGVTRRNLHQTLEAMEEKGDVDMSRAQGKIKTITLFSQLCVKPRSSG